MFILGKNAALKVRIITLMIAASCACYAVSPSERSLIDSRRKVESLGREVCSAIKTFSSNREVQRRLNKLYEDKQKRYIDPFKYSSYMSLIIPIRSKYQSYLYALGAARRSEENLELQKLLDLAAGENFQMEPEVRDDHEGEKEGEEEKQPEIVSNVSEDPVVSGPLPRWFPTYVPRSCAVYYGQLVLLEFMTDDESVIPINEGLSFLDGEGLTPLMQAAQSPHLTFDAKDARSLAVLIEAIKHSDFAARDRNGRTAIYIASANNNMPFLNALMSLDSWAENQNKEEIINTPAYGISPVLASSDPRVMDLLLKSGHHPEDPDKLWWAWLRPARYQILKSHWPQVEAVKSKTSILDSSSPKPTGVPRTSVTPASLE